MELVGVLIKSVGVLVELVVVGRVSRYVRGIGSVEFESVEFESVE